MNKALWVAAACAALVATSAEAHFKLNAPASMTQQNTNGDPQKTAPCGGAGTATNAVTTVQSGSMLTVTIAETVFHPGHYRVAIAQNETGLPPPPTVTPGGGDPCNSVPIAQNPMLPVLADGVFPHTQSFSSPQTTQIQLPAGYTCDNCVVQVLQYMKNHAAPCFYYHCAKVSITAGNTPPPDAGMMAGDDAGTGGGGGGGDGGGGCQTGRSTASGTPRGLAVLALVTRRRRRS